MDIKSFVSTERFYRLVDAVKASLKKTSMLLKNKTSSNKRVIKVSFKPPLLKRVQVVEFLSFDEIAFARSYSVVQVRDILKNELMNVYDIQLRYMNGGVYLLKEGDSLL